MPEARRASLYPAFERKFLEADERFTVIGTGEIGGKAIGLASIKRLLEETCPPGTFADVAISIPTLTVIATDVFEQFMRANDLYAVALSDASDERIAHAFQKAELPALVVGDLRALIAEMKTPLAVRSSSLLEDALQHPFAGTYATKMIANNQGSVNGRFQKLIEAIKFVWASTFFRDAKGYMRVIGQDIRDERMAVIVQEVVGQRRGERYYPVLSGVIRSYNHYPIGRAAPEDGVVNLALGLGKQIVDGGVCWAYSPRHPKRAMPFGSTRELLRGTQNSFWAVNMSPQVKYDPISEAEYLVQCGLDVAERDDVVRWVASTYDAASDRVVLGTGRTGPRVINFGTILELGDVPVNAIVQRLMACCREALGTDVEIEFAMTLGDMGRGSGGATETAARHRFGFLQLRPMMVGAERTEVEAAELASERAVVATEIVLGNGELTDVHDVVYVRPEVFEAKHTPAIAAELEPINRGLVEAGRPYVLIGFGRWGSSDPWLGVPVTWPQISGARVIVEATLPEMNVDPSQGTHFFHNMTSFEVKYLTVRHDGTGRIGWDWLAAQPVVTEGRFVRHVRAEVALTVRVDNRSRRGVVLRGGG